MKLYVRGSDDSEAKRDRRVIKNIEPDSIEDTYKRIVNGYDDVWSIYTRSQAGRSDNLRLLDIMDRIEDIDGEIYDIEYVLDPDGVDSELQERLDSLYDEYRDLESKYKTLWSKVKHDSSIFYNDVVNSEDFIDFVKTYYPDK